MTFLSLALPNRGHPVRRIDHESSKCAGLCSVRHADEFRAKYSNWRGASVGRAPEAAAGRAQQWLCSVNAGGVFSLLSSVGRRR